MSNFKALLAQAASDVYSSPNFRRSSLGGEYDYRPNLSGPKTAVYAGDTRTVVAHRGMVGNDLDDLNNTFARTMYGRELASKRLQSAHAVSRNAAALGKPVHHTGHSLGGTTARKVARDRGEASTGFNRWTGLAQTRENRQATQRCRQGSREPHCSNTEDVFNPQDVATMRINHDYGVKTRAKPVPPFTLIRGGPLGAHNIAQFTGGGKKGPRKASKAAPHPQQKLLDLALSVAKRR
jgi:hypothetical protein